MAEKWLIIRKSGDYKALGEKYHVSPIVARIMRNRGIESESDARIYLHGDAESLNDGALLKDCLPLVRVLRQKIEEKRKIRVIGDYDIDGVSATFILLKGLKKAGAAVDHMIPHRVKDGYGLNDNLIKEAYDAGIDTIITCDNGISAGPQIDYAHELGMTVLVTDHHEIASMPSAEAVVDPHRTDSDYPFKMLCGAAVAWKVLQVLFREMDIPESEAEEFLEIAAFATIGDVMPLIDENRILVKEGLQRLQNTENPGLRDLIALNGLSGRKLTPYHVGFVLGPCLNAAGRLDSAEYAIRLLLSETKDEAHKNAVLLKEMNDSRKTLTEKGIDEAVSIVSEKYLEQKVLVVELSDCHESIAGIVAGKVRERFQRPVFILTPGFLPDGTPCLKGSGRSIEEYHMFDAMNEVHELFERYGGHAMAAGLSILPEKLDLLRESLNKNCRLSENDLTTKVRIDMELPLRYASLELAEELEQLEPYGTGNEKPLFAARNVYLKDIRIFGEHRNVLKATAVDESGGSVDAVYFGDAESKKEYIEAKDKINITYYPDKNEYRNQVKLQIVIRNIM